MCVNCDAVEKHYMNPYTDVRKFHKLFKQTIGNKPGLPDDDIRKLRLKLLLEELGEYILAEGANDLEGIADGLVDMCYIAVGTCVAYGIPFDRIWDEVQHSNMAKADGGVNIRADGKVLKPEGWKPPNIKRILELAGGDCTCDSKGIGRPRYDWQCPEHGDLPLL